MEVTGDRVRQPLYKKHSVSSAFRAMAANISSRLDCMALSNEAFGCVGDIVNGESVDGGEESGDNCDGETVDGVADVPANVKLFGTLRERLCTAIESDLKDR
uniref:Uncharacterized protein n=1 Tax=Glossina austeni TaxID=7395 RepID=A0A1A9VN64_GLOAU